MRFCCAYPSLDICSWYYDFTCWIHKFTFFYQQIIIIIFTIVTILSFPYKVLFIIDNRGQLSRKSSNTYQCSNANEQYTWKHYVIHIEEWQPLQLQGTCHIRIGLIRTTWVIRILAYTRGFIHLSNQIDTILVNNFKVNSSTTIQFMLILNA